MGYSKYLVILMPVLAMTLAGCQKTKQVFGMNKNPPNEFAVMERAPLEVPPDFTLRPPRPGAKSIQEVADKPAHMKAKESVAKVSPTKNSPSKGEKELLQKAKASTKVDKGIRAKVDSEADAVQRKDEDKNWVAKKMPFYKAPRDKNVINPKQELERLKAEEKEMVEKEEK